MSTVVVVRKNDTACIAADSLTSFGDTKQSADFVSDANKIIHFEDFYLGIVGSAAHQLVIRSLLANHANKIDFSSQMAIFETLKQIHPILKEEYFLNSKDEEDDAYESSRVDALLMTPNGIFGIYSLREVDEYTRFWAVGSGQFDDLESHGWSVVLDDDQRPPPDPAEESEQGTDTDSSRENL